MIPIGIALGAAALALVVALVARRPVVALAGARQAVERPRRLFGVAVAFAIATTVLLGAMVVGTSVQQSLLDGAHRSLGETDVVVEWEDADPARVATLVAQVDALSDASALVERRRASIVDERTDLGEPRIALLGVDGDFRALGGLEPVAGALVEWGTDSLALGDRLARRLGATVGDEVVVREIVDGGGLATRSYTVAAIVRDAGFPMPADALAAYIARGDGADAVLLSAEPGVSSATLADAASLAVEDVETAEIEDARGEAVARASAEREEADAHFTAFGLFPILAGMLLAAVLVAMRVDARRAELATLRAVGATRADVTSLLVIENAVVGATGAGVGAFLGVIAGTLLTRVASGFSFYEGETIRVHVAASDVLAAVGWGFALAVGVALVAGWRASGFDVARGLRGEAGTDRRGSVAGLVALALVALAGAAATAFAIAAEDLVAAIAGPPLLALGLGAIAARRSEGGLATPISAALATAYLASTVFLLPSPDDSSMALIPVRGLLLAISASILAVTWPGPTRAAAWLASRVRGLDPVADAASGYARQRPGRAGSTVAVVALVLVVLVATSAMFASATSGIEMTRGGFDVLVTAYGDVEDPKEWLAANGAAGAVEGVETIVAMPYKARGLEGATVDGQRVAFGGSVSAATADFAATGSVDRALVERVLADPGLAIASEGLLVNDGFSHRGVREGDAIRLGPEGRAQEVRVIHVAPSGGFGTLLAHRSVFDALDADPSVRILVAVASGQDATEIARRLEAAFQPLAGNAVSFAELAAEERGDLVVIVTLLQSYLMLGLAVGIAAVGLVTARSVLERRREIGLLRALGATPAHVRRLFLFETLVGATLAALIGVGAGLLVGYGFFEAELSEGETDAFAVDWARVALFVGLTYALAVAAALLPATRAARIPPAQARRLAE